jgi:glutaminase
MVDVSSFDPIGDLLETIRSEFIGVDDGSPADYIPELSVADPNVFGLALAGVAGSVYVAGESADQFTIQSISKPFVYALALADVGPEGVLARVGVEPSGEAFNAISLEPGTGRPANPMVNAGAIVTSSLIRGNNPAERFERIREMLSRCAGRDLAVDEDVYRSEAGTGDRNRALAYLMRHAGSLTAPVEEVVDVYFRQCSIQVSAVDLAVMAATLANGGVNPRTGEAVIDPSIVEQVLTVMATCGMYDYSGEWLVRVGLPAKSGVAGGLIAVSPSQFGIGLFSPPLDARGNSVRAVAASRAISEQLSLHLMHQVRRTAPSFTRLPAPTAALDGHPNDRVAVLELQGYIEFPVAEQALLAVNLRATDAERPIGLVVDLNHVTRCNPLAATLLDDVIEQFGKWGVTVVTVDQRARHLLAAAAEFPTVDAALAHFDSP